MLDVEITPLVRRRRGTNTFRALRSYRATLDERGITRDGGLVIARSDLVSGQVFEGVLTWAVELRGASGQPSHLFKVADRAAGQAFLRELRLGPEDTVIDRRLPWAPYLHVPMTTVLTVLGILALVMFFTFQGYRSQALSLALVGSFAFGFFVGVWTRLRLVIGHEGFFVSTPRGRRFSAYADLREIRPWTPPRAGVGSDGVDLVCADGELIPVYTRIFDAHGVPIDVAAELESAWKRYRRTLEVDDEIKLRLARGARDLETWASDLARLGRHEPGYREVPLGRDELASLMETATASAEARAAAAYAITSSAVDPTVRHRIRLAADTVASPELRDALRELAELEEEEPRVRALRRIARD